MSGRTLLSLPSPIRWMIYRALNGNQVHIERTDTGGYDTDCQLLRVSKDFKIDVFEAYSSRSMTIVYTFKSPDALKHAIPSLSATMPRINMRLVLLHTLEDGSTLIPQPLRFGEELRVGNLLNGWRHAVNALPFNTVRELYIDVEHSWVWHISATAVLVGDMSKVLRWRGAHPIHILGCKTENGRRIMEYARSRKSLDLNPDIWIQFRTFYLHGQQVQHRIDHAE